VLVKKTNTGGEIEDVIREQIPLKTMPSTIEIEETSKDEKQSMARELDYHKQKADPTFKGAFHERKGKKKWLRVVLSTDSEFRLSSVG
jgi:hypothetical protein